MKRHAKVVLAILPFAILLSPVGIGCALAQANAGAPVAAAPTAAITEAPYTQEFEGHFTVRRDRSLTQVVTNRFKILTQSAVQAVSQQNLVFVDGLETLDTVEAFTEKPDGRHVPVDPKNILTQDATPGLPGTYARDLKQRTIIFPDVGIGDTLVMTHRRATAKGISPRYISQAEVFPRSAAFTSIKITVEAPAAIGLRVKATGNGATESFAETGGTERHTILITPDSYAPEEAGAVSPFDRDPIVVMSNLKSYEEVGSAYGENALPKAAVTPGIATLANEITKGITDRKAQAIAIDAWMKKNIRYVAVLLSTGRFIPNDAATVLKNRFGDCKDKTTLMAALLTAKGIASEPALISAGNAYALPEPPTPSAFNHVILYLPEFDLYDDPTASQAAFGILSIQTYDKPVVRVSAAGARLAHTPAMNPDDHTAYVRTTINVAADGTVTGRTEERNTGVLGAVLRTAGATAQTLGDEAARRRLQNALTPGTGHFDLGNFAETADPVAITGSFKLDTPFKLPPTGGRAGISRGMGLMPRPESFMLGTRLSGRKAAFVCLAGRQAEDIEATFDPALPMPLPFRPVAIDNAAFSYQSTMKIEGRTLKVHREFVSRVRRQVCPPELESQIAADLTTVQNSIYALYTFVTPASLAALRQAASKTQDKTLELSRVVAANQKLRVDFLYAINPDCSSIGQTAVRVIEPPKHGSFTTENGQGFTSFPKDNPRSECNTRKTDGVIDYYEPEPDFTGTDSFTIDVIYASGTLSKRHYAIKVE